MDVFDLRARVSADASPFNTAMDSSATSVSAALSAISSAASMFVGNSVVRAFSRATDAAYEFGQVMADISSISDVGIQQLSKNIKQLDNVYGSMSNVGNSIYNIISSGFDRSNDELIEIVKQVVDTWFLSRSNMDFARSSTFSLHWGRLPGIFQLGSMEFSNASFCQEPWVSRLVSSIR